MHTRIDHLDMKKKLLLLFIFVLSSVLNTSLYSMTFMRRLTYRTPASSAGQSKRFIRTQPISPQTQPNLSWRAKLADVTVAAGSRLKGILSHYWYGTTLTSNNIIEGIRNYQSSRPDPVLCEQIKNFLKENTPDDSKDVFNALMQRNILYINFCLSSLQTMIKEDDDFALKIMHMVEIFFQQPDTTMELKEENVAYILASIPNRLDPLKLDQLKSQFWNSIRESIWIINWLEQNDNNLILLLPHDTNLFIKSIIDFCETVESNKYSFNQLISAQTPLIAFTNTIEEKNLADVDLNKLLSILKKTRYGSEINLMFEPKTPYRLVCGMGNSHVPSCRHLQKYQKDIIPGSSLQAILIKDNFLHMLRSVIEKEKEAMNHNEIFYTGRNWQYGFFSDIFGILHSHKTNDEYKDFIFTHPAIKAFSEASFNIGSRFLFLNKFLFGNLTTPVSNSINYVISNQSVNDILFSIQEIFSMFEYENVYKKHEKKLLDLQQEYNSLSKYGELLQILVPKKIVGKYIHYTNYSGNKEEYYLPDGTMTTDTNKILQNENKNPHDRGEYTLENRNRFGGLDPKSGIKIYSYNTIEPAKWDAFQAKLNNFALELKRSLRQADIQKQREQIAKE